MLTDVLDREISLRLCKCKGGIKGGRTMSISKVKRSKDARMAGVLMPVASLPSKDGVGNFGKEAYAFVDKLADMGIRIWQILPLNPLGYGNSPYQPFSSYAGDELYIDLDLLAEAGYLTTNRDDYETGENPNRIEYEKARAYKVKYLKEAYKGFYEKSWESPEFEEFRKKEWVYPYAVFIALKKQNNLRCWNEWPQEQQDWILDKKYDISPLQEEINYQMFSQYMFYKQWMALKEYANKKNVLIMGDIPIYVGIDSLDVWSCREDFLLDAEGKPSFVAGVPPDYFSATGQRWGNPIYNWENMQKKNFVFWMNRLSYSSELYDIIRIDHFRAFDTYWKIPASCDTAIEGEWVEAPGYELFDEIYRQMPDIKIVAEDLGDLRPEVLELRDHYNLIGMNIAEFSLPSTDAVKEHQLIYTGTHDNQTVKGWFDSLDTKTKVKVRKTLAKHGKSWENFTKKMVRFVYRSNACMAIVPVADILGLDDKARLNTPGTVGSPNWEWRLTDWTALDKEKEDIAEILLKAKRTLS